MSSDSDRLAAIEDELSGILEERITELLAHMRALREVTSQIAATELDIRRQEQVHGQLESELGPLTARSDALDEENEEIQRRVDALRENVSRARKLREELMSNLSGLTSELKGLQGGS